MQDNYWINEYYRNRVPFYFYCPYCKPYFNDYERGYGQEFDSGFKYDTNNVFETPEDLFVRYPIYGENKFRTRSEIEKIAKAVYEEISKDIKFLESMPITKELMHYLIKVIGDYIDKNHEKYIGPIEMKVEGLMKELRKDLYWVFEILALFGVTPEAAVYFVESVINKFLRELMPEKNEEQNSPMWGM